MKKEKNLTLLNYIIFSVCILTSTAYSTTFYVNNSKGNDKNNGTSANTPWKSLNSINSRNFEASDIILFKKGEIWNGRLNISNEHGIDADPIVIKSYGSGAAPIITTIGKMTDSWSSVGDGVWKYNGNATKNRLWRNGVEQKRTGRVTEPKAQVELCKVAGVVWTYRNEKVHYCSSSNPSKGNTFTSILDTIAIGVQSASYIEISELDIRGGSLNLQNSNNITVRKNLIGNGAVYGILANKTDNILIENNIFDSKFRLTFKDISSYEGTDNRGCEDAISAFGRMQNSKIRNNTFINWHHAAIGLELSGHTNNSIHHNYFTTKGLLYGRAFAISHDKTQNNEIHHNLIENMGMRSQLNGKNNHYHHNWFLDTKDTPYKNRAEGQAFALEPYSGNPTGNIFEHNTIDGADDSCIEIIAQSTNGSYNINSNIFRKNLLKNCGRNPYYAWAKDKGISIQNYADIQGNTFIDNAFIGTKIYHRKKQVTPSEFNARNGVSGDKISNNSSTLSNQGAGVLNRSLIGANFSKSTFSTSTTSNESTSTASNESTSTNAFIMTKDGQLK